MEDVPEKVRHAVQMAVVARTLAGATPDPYRQRVVARYVFVYLDDVVRYAPAWRNTLRRDPKTSAAADSAEPALTRLRADWRHYEDIRNFIAAKRQLRDPLAPEANEIDGLRRWGDIGTLAVDTLVDDAIEIYAQLGSVSNLDPVELSPAIPQEVVEALAALDPIGEEGALAVVTTSFGAARAGAVTLRMGGEVGRLVPLINDVVENIQTLSAILRPADANPLLMRLLQCQLPSEIYELLRLTLGAEPGAPASSQASLLALYQRPDAPPRPRAQLEAMQDYVDRCLQRAELRRYRNELGAHIDDDAPWPKLEEGMSSIDLGALSRVTQQALEYLECCAVEPGGPFPLLFPSRQLATLVATQPTTAVEYDDPDAADTMANLPSSGPPAGFGSGHTVWVRGAGTYGSAAVAGMHARRATELRERQLARQGSKKT